MKTRIQPLSALSLVVFLITSLSIMSCGDEQTIKEMALTGQSKTYNVNQVANSGIAGTVTLKERTDHSTLVVVQLDGTTSGTMYPAHIYSNSIIESGDRIIDLYPVDGANGTSETVIRIKKNGNLITYDQFLALNAHVNIALSETNVATAIAQADVGGNEITDTFITYTLSPAINSNLTGTVRFTKRVNGNTLVDVDLEGASPIGSYLAFICENDAASDGKIVISLNSIHGGVGTSVTDVSHFNDGKTISFDQLLVFDGHVKITSAGAMPVCMTQSDIGVNGSPLFASSN